MTPSTPSSSQASSTSLRARPRYDAIVIGGGVNGLTCATLLAKNGVHTLLLEQRAELGGCASEGEITAGFRVPMLAHATGPVRRDVVEELQLYLHGLAFTDSPLHISTLSPDGRPLVVYGDSGRTAESLRAWSAKDAARWPQFQGALQRLGGLIGSLFMYDAAVGGLALGARCVCADAYARRLPRAAQGRSMAPAALGTDGGRGSGQRIDRYGIAARGGCGRRDLRRHAWAVVGRQRIAAAVDDGQSIAGLAGRTAGQRRPGRAGAFSHRRGDLDSGSTIRTGAAGQAD